MMSYVALCMEYGMYLFFFFFFQAEDGIRDLTVTGVQTCALPISDHPAAAALVMRRPKVPDLIVGLDVGTTKICAVIGERSEERRVGKECRSRWSPYH